MRLFAHLLQREVVQGRPKLPSIDAKEHIVPPQHLWLAAPKYCPLNHRYKAVNFIANNQLIAMKLQRGYIISMLKNRGHLALVILVKNGDMYSPCAFNPSKMCGRFIKHQMAYLPFGFNQSRSATCEEHGRCCATP